MKNYSGEQSTKQPFHSKYKIYFHVFCIRMRNYFFFADVKKKIEEKAQDQLKKSLNDEK